MKKYILFAGIVVVILSASIFATHLLVEPNIKRNEVKFNQVAVAFEAIEKVSSRLEITRLLADLLKEASPQEASIIVNLSLGQLQPPYLGTQFNLNEKTLVPVVAHLLGISEQEVQTHARKLGDLGSVLFEGNWRASQELSVLQVFKALQDIEHISGTGSQEEKSAAMQKLMRELDQTSAKYVLRIVIGKLRLGFSDMTIIDALSVMEVGDKSLRKIIENAYNICADIGLIASTLKSDGIKKLEHMHAQIGIPILPAAAERLPTAKAIFEKLGPCVAQPKLDGFRLQIHVDKRGKTPKIHFFSRNLIDMSYMFPDMTLALADLDVEDIICEGEAIVYDPNTGSFLPFQETAKRKRKHDIEKTMEELPLKIFIFDLLYLNGKEYLSKTHEERRAQAISVFKSLNNDAVSVIDEVPMHSPHELEQYFLSNISSGLEGLVVKRPDAVYQPGKRNFNWIKLKRQEEGHLEDTLDCVVLGYYPGKGKRAGFGIGAFLVGVFNKKEDCFETVAKIGTGLKDDEWKELKKKCDAIAVKEQPHNVVCAKELAPRVWTAPELVVLIRADEITLSPLHAAGKSKDKPGYALRFPRFMGYREDKNAYEATTAHEVERLYEDQYVK
jgi:DNA ligase-1